VSSGKAELLKYSDVPKDREGNLDWRRFITRKGVESDAFAALLRRSCKADPLFYFNSFIWTLDPRIKIVNGVALKRKPCLPLITYDYQDSGITDLIDCIYGAENALCRKSRDMGMTVCVMNIADWDWRFNKERKILCLSRKEDYVDKSDNPDTLFAKVDYTEERLPSFLRVPRVRTSLHIYNPETRSVIDGESTNNNAARGGRRSWIFADEFAFVDNGMKIINAVTEATSTCIYGSTPNGVGTAFHMLETSDIKKIDWHWSLHPEKNIGLYKVDKDGVELLDTDYFQENDYECLLEPGGFHGLRSPWYDAKCEKSRGNKTGIAQELDMDSIGSGTCFFEHEALQAAREMGAISPFIKTNCEGYLNRKVRDHSPNPLSLWLHNIDQDDYYVFGIDISTGTGASDSAISIISAKTKTKVADYISNRILSEDLAILTKHLSERFTTSVSEPYVIWDQGGEGHAFSTRLMELHGIRNVYRYRSKKDKIKAGRPGYPATPQTKLTMFATLREALSNSRYVERSNQVLNELVNYAHGPNGTVVHVKESSDNFAGNKKNHGDVAYATALAVMALESGSVELLKSHKTKTCPHGSWAWRREQAEKQKVEVTWFG